MTRDERLQRLERRYNALVVHFRTALERITELEVQARFALSVMRIAKPPDASALVDPTGQPRLQVMDGFAAYTKGGGREKTLELLEREYLVEQFTDEAFELKRNGDERSIETITSALIDDYLQKRAAHSAAGANGSAVEGEGSDDGLTLLDDAAETRH